MESTSNVLSRVGSGSILVTVGFDLFIYLFFCTRYEQDCCSLKTISYFFVSFIVLCSCRKYLPPPPFLHLSWPGNPSLVSYFSSKSLAFKTRLPSESLLTFRGRKHEQIGHTDEGENCQTGLSQGPAHLKQVPSVGTRAKVMYSLQFTNRTSAAKILVQNTKQVSLLTG